MSFADITLFALRAILGLIFAAHGAQKAFGWWNGPGYQRWTQAIASMRIHPVGLWAFVSVAAELGAGLALAVGLLTPFAVAALIGQSVVIIIKVHLPKGFFNSTGGIEFPLSLVGGLLAIMGLGAGALAIDAAVGLPAFSVPFRLLLLGIGFAGGLVALSMTRLQAAEQPLPAPR